MWKKGQYFQFYMKSVNARQPTCHCVLLIIYISCILPHFCYTRRAARRLTGVLESVTEQSWVLWSWVFTVPKTTMTLEKGAEKLRFTCTPQLNDSCFVAGSAVEKRWGRKKPNKINLPPEYSPSYHGRLIVAFFFFNCCTSWTPKNYYNSMLHRPLIFQRFDDKHFTKGEALIWKTRTENHPLYHNGKTQSATL